MLKLFTIVTLFLSMVWASEARSLDLTSWMFELDDSRLITQISIPGTHDSAADRAHCQENWKCAAVIEFASTQQYNIPTQLTKGVRFFDIRLAYEDGFLRFHHGSYYLEEHFDYAIDAAQDFLASNPSEFVIFLIKQEHTSVSANTFWERAHTGYLNLDKYNGLFYLEKRVLTVEEARGKIIIMGREGSSEHKQGFHVNWDSNTSHYEYYSYDKDINDVMRYIVEDHYSLKSVSKETKFAWIAQNLRLAGLCTDCKSWCTTCGYKKTLYITFLSGEGDPNTSKEPSDFANYENPQTATWLHDHPVFVPGIVAIDYAGDPEHGGDTVITEVIEQNFKY